jgi:hypothetical protein
MPLHPDNLALADDFGVGATVVVYRRQLKPEV